MFIKNALYAHHSGDMRPRVVTLKLEVFIFEAEDILYVGIEPHPWQRARSARELELHLLQMVQLYMCVACGVDEFAGLQSAHLCHHLQE